MIGNQDLVNKSQEYLSQNNKYLGFENYFFVIIIVITIVVLVDSNQQWGRMQKVRWTFFLDWLFSNSLVVSRTGETLQRSSIDENEIFTNQFFN